MQRLPAIGVITHVILFHVECPIGVRFRNGLLQLLKQVIASAAGDKSRLRSFECPAGGVGCRSLRGPVFVDDLILECGALPY